MVFDMVNGMKSSTLSIDGAGRVVLPKALRERYRLRSGSRLELIARDGHIELRPLDLTPALSRERGWWVHQGLPEDEQELLDALERDREERIEDLSK